MYVTERAVNVLQMFCLSRLHFDILLGIVMKAAEWKTLLEDICRRTTSTWNLDAITKRALVCLCTERNWIKPPSDWLLIDFVMCSKKDSVCVCVCVCVCVWAFKFGSAMISRQSQEHKQVQEGRVVYFYCEIISSHGIDHRRYQRCTLPSPSSSSSPRFLPSLSSLALIWTLDSVMNAHLIQHRLSNMTHFYFSTLNSACVCVCVTQGLFVWLHSIMTLTQNVI